MIRKKTQNVFLILQGPSNNILQMHLFRHSNSSSTNNKIGNRWGEGEPKQLWTDNPIIMEGSRSEVGLEPGFTEVKGRERNHWVNLMTTMKLQHFYDTDTIPIPVMFTANFTYQDTAWHLDFCRRVPIQNRQRNAAGSLSCAPVPSPGQCASRWSSWRLPACSRWLPSLERR